MKLIVYKLKHLQNLQDLWDLIDLVCFFMNSGFSVPKSSQAKNSQQMITDLHLHGAFQFSSESIMYFTVLLTFIHSHTFIHL